MELPPAGVPAGALSLDELVRLRHGEAGTPAVPCPARRRPHEPIETRTAWNAVLVGGIALSCLVPTRASAVPVFSRKYQTSCQTCHSIFPKLNPFGEAFRLNGYRLPGETEEQVKQKPVSLGADAYERIWPEMVYPSTLPGNVPFALNVKMADLYASSHDDAGQADRPQRLPVPAGGEPLRGRDRSGRLQLLRRGDVRGEPRRSGAGDRARPPRLDSRSAPTTCSTSGSGSSPQPLRRLPGNVADDRQRCRHALRVQPDRLQRRNGARGRGRGVSLPARPRAIEMYGVAAHRLFYTVGVALPSAPEAEREFGSNSSKDFYARVDYKFGGMGLDGDTTGVKLPPENWRETSFRLGVFGYAGDGTDVDFDSPTPRQRVQDAGPRYDRVGVYGSLLLRRPEPLRCRRPRERRPFSSRPRDRARFLDTREPTTPGSRRRTG